MDRIEAEILRAYCKNKRIILKASLPVTHKSEALYVHWSENLGPDAFINIIKREE